MFSNGSPFNGFPGGKNPAITTLPVPAADGGTGHSSYTKGDILVASAATTLGLLSVGTDGYVIVADSAQTLGVKWAALSTLGVTSATGTIDQIYVNGTYGLAQTGALVLTLPQDIATNSTPQFAGINFSSAGDSTIGKIAPGVGNLIIDTSGTGGQIRLKGSTVPDADNVYALGSVGLRFNNIVGDQLRAVTSLMVDYLTFQGSGAGSAWTWTLPPDAGTNLYALLTNGSGVTTWNAIVNSVTGTANQVIASAGTGAITLSLPQSIATSSSPTFAGLTLDSASDTTLFYKESGANRWSSSYSVAGNYFYYRDTQNSRDLLTLYDDGTSQFNQGHLGIGTTNDGTKTIVISSNANDVYGIQLFGTRTAVDGSSNTFSYLTAGIMNPTSGSTSAFSFGANPSFIAPMGQTMINNGGLYIYNIVSSNVGTVANLYGAFIDTGSASAGTVSSSWGLWCRLQTAGSNRYGAYFEDFVGIGTSTPAHSLELSNDDAAKSTTNTWTVTSDVAVKQNIRDVSSATDLIKQLRPRVFNYTDDHASRNPNIVANKDYYGFVANEVEPILPDCVKSVSKRYITQDELGNVTSEEVQTLKTFNPHIVYVLAIQALKELDARLALVEAKTRAMPAL